MTSNFINSHPRASIDQSRENLYLWMQRCRNATLELLESIDDDVFCLQIHPDYSPIGWHFGHIAYTEALWLLESDRTIFPEYRRLFAADGLPKKDRVHLPSADTIHEYLDTVRNQVFHSLLTVDLDRHERLWRWLIQHETQHCETIAFLQQLHQVETRQRITVNPSPGLSLLPDLDMVEIPAGEFEMGNDSIDALDNERPVHRVNLDAYQIDRYPVTCGEYRAFIQAGGYQNPDCWSSAGWQWLQDNPVTQPLYWVDDSAFDTHPVCGVSWYEADAYARFVGKRLPTEAEWEKAAGWDAQAQSRRTYPWGETLCDRYFCNHDNIIGQTTPVNAYPEGQSAYGCYDMLGNVWEWTHSWFDGYEGFVSYPYPGYSKVYFDKKHRVLRGGSWTTRSWGLRCAFRNWYHPNVRQIFAGFRCAR